MITSPLKLVAGSHVWIALENDPLTQALFAHVPQGTAGTPVTVAKNAKPYRSDLAWRKLGIIDTFRIRAGSIAPIPVHASSPGHLVVDDIIAVGQERMYTIRCKEIQQLTVQLLNATSRLASDAIQFNPDEGLAAIKAWMKSQLYDNQDRLLWTVDQWGLISCPEDVEFSNKALTEVTYEFACIQANLNTGS